jgi:hypothetical protein
MTLEHWAYIAEIVGAIVIVASLVYVAAQVRQNTKAQLAASRQATLAADLEFLSMMVDYPEDAVGLGAELEDVRSTAFLVAYLRIREFAWYQYQSGILDRTTWESYLAPTAVVFDSELAKRIWASSVIRLDAGFRAQIDHMIGSDA